MEFRKEHQIIDSSKINDFITCERYYLLRHIFGWEKDVPNHDAFFGECWHKAREYQLLNGYEKISEAFEIFMDAYREKFSESTDELYAPKNPAGALTGLIEISKFGRRDLIDNEVVKMDGEKMTEISGRVPISNNRFLYYRLDSIMRRKEDGKIFSWDHKTTKRFSRPWRDQFYLGIQNGTYTHCLYCLFPPEQVLGVEFYGTCFEYLKRTATYRISFELVPAFKTLDQMSGWLWLVNDIYDRIMFEMERLDKASEDDEILTAFPCRPTSCTKYFGCEFHDYCLAWQNPLQKSSEPPLGFRVNFWNPEEMDTRLKRDLELK